MKRGFILFLEIAVLVVFLQSSFVQYMLKDIQVEVSSWFAAVSNYAHNKRVNGLLENMQPHMGGLSEQQIQYIEGVAENRDKLEQFNRMYCIGNDKNPFVYGTTLRVFCGQIQSSNVLSGVNS